MGVLYPPRPCPVCSPGPFVFRWGGFMETSNVDAAATLLWHRILADRWMGDLWATHARGKPLVSKNAAVLLEEILGDPSLSSELIAPFRNSTGRFLETEKLIQRLARWVEAPPLSRVSCKLRHALAVYWWLVGGALSERDVNGSAVARMRSIAAWCSLVCEKRYLDEAAKTYGGGIAEAESERIARETVTRHLRALFDAANAPYEKGEPSTPARAALSSLRRVPAACAMAKLSKAESEPFERIAESLRRDAVDTYLKPIDDAFAEAKARGALETDAFHALQRAIPIWKWTEEDPYVEIFVAERAPDILWHIYRSANGRLKEFVGPFEPLLESLSKRIEPDSTYFAFAAACATMFMFMAESRATAAESRAILERALLFCPLHKNCRSVLAHYLCDDVVRSLAGSLPIPSSEEARVRALVARAESLFPNAKRLPAAREALARRNIALGTP